MSVIDRSNLAYAELQMRDDLSLSQSSFGLAAGVFDEETRVAFSLARVLRAAPDKAAAWNEQWAAIYKLADLVCARHLASAAPPPGFDAPGFQEPLVDRYQDRSDRGQL